MTAVRGGSDGSRLVVLNIIIHLVVFPLMFLVSFSRAFEQQHLAAPGRGLIEIEALVVPARVENGTEDSVILDCIYSFDKEQDKKLVVKWFFNDDPEPIYQWIPELKSRILSSRLQGKINMDFSVGTGNSYTQYRAINLVRPTTDLSGTYSCHVASLKSQDYKEKKMLVYAAPKNITFDFTRTSRLLVSSSSSLPSSSSSSSNSGAGGSSSQAASSSASKSSSTTSSSSSGTSSSSRQNGQNGQNGLVGTKREMMALSDSSELSPGATLKCGVEEVFPKPDIAIYRLSNDGSGLRFPLLNAKRTELVSANRAHNVEISAQVVEAELTRKYGKEPYTFECLVSLDINGGNITRTSRLTYFWATSGAGSAWQRLPFSSLPISRSLDVMSTLGVRFFCCFLCSLYSTCHFRPRWLGSLID